MKVRLTATEPINGGIFRVASTLDWPVQSLSQFWFPRNLGPPPPPGPLPALAPPRGAPKWPWLLGTPPRNILPAFPPLANPLPRKRGPRGPPLPAAAFPPAAAKSGRGLPLAFLKKTIQLIRKTISKQLIRVKSGDTLLLKYYWKRFYTTNSAFIGRENFGASAIRIKPSKKQLKEGENNAAAQLYFHEYARNYGNKI